MTSKNPTHVVSPSGAYAQINGLNMYYETYGSGGVPLMLIHGGGSTIQTSFGRLIPLLSANRTVIAVEMQAHGRTGDRDAALSFKQDADDIAALMDHLGIAQANILGFSNGGQTAIEIGLRHAGRINKLIIAGAFYKRSAVADMFWEGMGKATFEDMPQPFKDAFLEVNNDREALMNMFERDVQRMQQFEGWIDEQVGAISARTLVMSGDSDVGSVEHAVALFRAIPGCRLAILPGGHGRIIGELMALDEGKWQQEYAAGIIEEFLEASL